MTIPSFKKPSITHQPTNQPHYKLNSNHCGNKKFVFRSKLYDLIRTNINDAGLWSNSPDLNSDILLPRKQKPTSNNGAVPAKTQASIDERTVMGRKGGNNESYIDRAWADASLLRCNRTVDQRNARDEARAHGLP